MNVAECVGTLHLPERTRLKERVIWMRKFQTLGRGMLAVALAAAVATPFALTACGGNEPDAGTASEGQTQGAEPEEAPAEQEPYTIADEQLDDSNQFVVYVTGTLTNNTDDEVGYIQVEYNLYDADGAQVGTALANTNNLKAGGAWKFEALGTASPDEVASYELVDVTSF